LYTHGGIFPALWKNITPPAALPEFAKQRGREVKRANSKALISQGF